jgi:hypothetical protein
MALSDHDRPRREPSRPARQRPAPPRRAQAKERDRKALAEAMGELTALLPGSVTAEAHGERRTTALKAGLRYRVEPLSQRRKRDRGRLGTLVSWSLDGSTGMMRWEDGTVGEVRLEDLAQLD